jgi:hypothetical protein
MCKEKAEYILKEGWDDTTLWNRSPFSAWHFHRYTDKSKTPWKVTLCEWEDAGIDTKLKKHIFDFDKESIPNIYP